MFAKERSRRATEPKSRLPEEAIDEMQRLIESYARLKSAATGQHAGADEEIGRLQSRLDHHTVKWSDLGQAELCTIELLGDDDVRARLASWRRRMHEIIGDARYASYIATSSDPKTAGPAVLRADLAECIGTVSYFYGAYGVAARSRAEVTAALIRFAALVLGAQSVLCVLVALAPRAHLALPVVALEYLVATSAAAVIGSVISVQRRLQDPRVEVDPFYRFIQTNADRFGIAFVSVLFGAIFGLAVYALLLSGLIAGPEFPKIDPRTGIPQNPQQVTLLLVYGFLAGFAEQLGPDALTRIAARTVTGIIGAPASPSKVDKHQPGPSQ